MLADEQDVGGIAPDLYGYGETDPWLGGGTLALADEMAVVDAVVSRSHRPVHLVGRSYGDVVALRMALQHLDRLHSLCAVESVAFNVRHGGGMEEHGLILRS